jgi:hypothetical protein
MWTRRLPCTGQKVFHFSRIEWELHKAAGFLRETIITELFKFLSFYGDRRFVTLFTVSQHYTLLWAIYIQSKPSHPVSLVFHYFILSVYRSSYYKSSYALTSAVFVVCPVRLIFIDFTTLITDESNHAISNMLFFSLYCVKTFFSCVLKVRIIVAFCCLIVTCSTRVRTGWRENIMHYFVLTHQHLY